ncbi:MAG TPA: helix-turn-helix transcriptional regulator [Firmicutes bacterium]|nr:helix-turn-helix transcriptional regulator [Bacillota bacterium]
MNSVEGPFSDTFQRTIEYIEKNIKNNISLDDLAKASYMSKFHLSRVFQSITGYPPIEYARARKLTCSLNELIHTDRKISDIAQEYGFDHEQSYIRAFKRHFGMTPAQFRCLAAYPELVHDAMVTPDNCDLMV